MLHDARELDLILCEQHARTLTKNLAISFEGRTYQVTGHGKGYRLRGARVTVCKAFDGAVTVLRDGRELPARLLAEGAAAPPVEDGKTVRRARRRVQGGAGFAAGLQAAARPPLAETVQARGGRRRLRIRADLAGPRFPPPAHRRFTV